MEISRVPKLNTVECPHGDRHLMESAQDWPGVEVVIGNNGPAQAFVGRRNRVSQWRDVDSVLSLPVQALRGNNTRAHAQHDNGQQHDGLDGSKMRPASDRARHAFIRMCLVPHNGFSLIENWTCIEMALDFLF